MQKPPMAQDYCWNTSAMTYFQLYENLLHKTSAQSAV
jgi:hypothetical protein